MVAPGWVLTCAHLFVSAGGERRGTAEGETVGVQLGGRLLRGRLAYLVEEFRDGRAPDLALVALPEGPERPEAQPVAWLGEREPLLCENAHLYGYQPGGAAGEGFTPVDSSCRVTGQDGRYLQVAAVSRLRKGYSGGPLVDEDRGEVVGLVRARDGDELGLVVPVGAVHELAARHHRPGAPDLGPQPGRELLRRHDVWHVRHQDRPGRTSASWTDVRRRLPRQRGSWTPLDRLAELDWLSRLPAPARPEVVGQLMPNVAARPADDWPVPLLTWRDGYVRLGDSEAHHLRFLLAVVAELSRGPDPAVRETVTGLASWVSVRRREVALAERPELEHARRRPESVLLEFTPLLGYGRQERAYRWSISHGFGEGEWRPARQGGDDPGRGGRLSLPEAVGEVRDQLRDVLLDADGPQPDGREARARVEVAAPMAELLAPAHAWRAGSGRLGTEREVVLRHRPPAGAPGDDPALRAHQWQRLATARRLAPRPVEADTDLLQARNGLGGTLMALAELDEAHELYESVWQQYSAVLGPEDPTTLQARGNYGLALSLLGRYQDALTVHGEVLAVRERLLPRGHHQTLQSGLLYARILRLIGRYPEAQSRQELNARQHRQILGQGNPATLAAEHNLAQCMRRSGDLAGGAQLMRAVVNSSLQLHGPGSPDTILVQADWATFLRQRGDLTAAAELSQAVTDQYHDLVGPAHPYTVGTRGNLALLHQVYGERHTALRIATEAWEGMAAAVGPDHPWTLGCALNLSAARQLAGDDEAALALSRDTLARSTAALGPEHPLTFSGQAALAMDLRLVREADEAARVETEVLARLSRVLGPEHPHTVAVRRRDRPYWDFEPQPI
nr:tetratricopeptide repeat protein [Kitasatospora sp. SID7827]